MTQDELKKLLNYDPSTGIFTWIIKKAGIRNGHIAGSKCHEYLRVRIKQKDYLSHRLAWLYIYGYWPKNCIDHINGIKTDNRICNLREATYSQNNHNSSINSKNQSGIKGIGWSKRSKKWIARLKLNDKYVFVKYFENIDDAITELSEARTKWHGEFANEGHYQ